MKKVAVDAMGGDFAPLEIVLGGIQAVRDYKIPIVLVGDSEQIRKILADNGEDANSLIEVIHASQVIEMGEHPGMAFRKKKDASISVAARLVKQGKCDAVVAPGSTGAAVTAGLLGIGRIKGIERPAIVTPIPNEKGGHTFLIDARHIKEPRVGLLNIGSESTKGSALMTETYELLSKQTWFPFAGNAEGRDIPTGEFDVVVSDGFTGNVVLKFGEGLGKLFITLLKDSIYRGGVLAKLGGLLLKPALKKYMMKKFDYAEEGGAPLLGIDGTLIISHGSSRAKAIRNAIRLANQVAEEEIPTLVKNTLNVAIESE